MMLCYGIHNSNITFYFKSTLFLKFHHAHMFTKSRKTILTFGMGNTYRQLFSIDKKKKRMVGYGNISVVVHKKSGRIMKKYTV